MSARRVVGRVALACIAGLLCAGTASSQSATGGAARFIRNLDFRVLDLDYKVIDLGGKVVDLEVKETDLEVVINLAADVLFDFDKDTLKPEAKSSLEQAASIIRDQTKGNVRIEGHTDAKGDDSYNQNLSNRRAASVKSWFSQHGNLGGREMSTQGFGETKPVAPNARPDGSDDPDGRQKNRRVEITVKK